jgi:ppGpp synthetase/RelA/SpoT-type nucleotidyltranferase
MDLDQLLELLSAYSVALDQATERVRGTIGIAPSARVKNTATILEKLDRNGGVGAEKHARPGRYARRPQPDPV